MNLNPAATLAVAFIAIGLPACHRRPHENSIAFPEAQRRQILGLSPLPPPPPNPTNRFLGNPAAEELGRRLFFEKRLSINNTISCATCHDPARGFADGKPQAEGLGTTERHAMALWNVAQQRWFLWDGRADSLWAQARHPMLHPAEMGASPAHLRDVIRDGPALKTSYETLFGPIPTDAASSSSLNQLLANLGKALEAFERRIVSSQSPFDDFVAALRAGSPDEAASRLGNSALRGLQLFTGRGRCILCHAGPNFSDGEFHNIGLSNPTADQGRFSGIIEVRDDPFNGLGEFSDDRSPEANIKIRYLTVKPNHLGEFKTPTLRHVARTAPYMHDGRFATLRQVLDFYSELPEEPILGHREETLVPLHLTEQEKSDLEAFLNTLTGAPLDDSITQPPAR